MVRSRVRTTEKANWSEEDLRNALQLIHDGNSVNDVAILSKIPRSTLRDRMKSNNVCKPTFGRRPIFTPEQENELADQVLLLETIFYSLSLTDLRSLAFELADKYGIKNNFNRQAKMAGEDWALGFIKRNPKINLRKPESSIDKEVEFFFDNLSKIMEKVTFEASQIYNMDEAGIFSDKKFSNLERGKIVAVCCAVSASGVYVPPMFIYPLEHLSPELRNGGPEGAIYHRSNNGWINRELFIDWLEHFKRFAKPSEDKPVLLVLGSNKSHISLRAYQFCKENYIYIVSFPSHTSEQLQPLDISFFEPLKIAFNIECDLFLRSQVTPRNPSPKITLFDFAFIFNQALMTVATVENGTAGFKSAGIYPFNPSFFWESLFPSQYANQPKKIKL